MRYDRLLTILAPVASVNDMNETVNSWSQLCVDRPCKHYPVSDGERLSGGEKLGFKKSRFQIRYSTDVASVDNTYRVSFGGRLYDINGVKELGRMKQLEITATARSETP